MPKKGTVSKRMWKFVFYPESAPDWKETIEDWGVPVLVSPLHNMDINVETGEVKKPHYHGIAYFDGPTPYSQMVELVEALGVHTAKPVNSRSRDERYLCHLDSKDKYVYNVEDISMFGGAMPKFLCDKQEQSDFAAVHNLIEELGIINYADLANEIVFGEPDLLPLLTRYTVHFNNVCRARADLVKYADNGSYVNSRRKCGRYAC